MCVAPTRAEAEDLAAEIELDFEPLPAVVDMLDGAQARRAAGARALGRQPLPRPPASTWTSRPSKPRPPCPVTRELRTARQVMCPIEGRGVVAQWDSRLGQLVVHTSTQQPHIVRSGLAECLGLDEGQIRVVAPDVGGGFGYKGILLPEEVALRLGDAQARRPAALARGPAREPDRQRQLPRAPLHPHRLRRRATAGCWRSTARPPSIPAPTRPIRSPPASRPARSARSCRASTTSRTTAAAPTRSPPTSRRSCPTAAWPAPACASRWR